MDIVVISIGGSVLIPDKGDFEYLSELANLLRRLSSQFKLYLVTGGGRIARYYIDLARRFGAEESYLDEIGVQVTRLNARLLICALLGEACNSLPKSVEEAVKLGKKHRIVVMGGTTPGHTTDGVASMLAEALGADRIINATSVDGIYSKDPKKHKDAKRIDRLSFEDLLEFCRTSIWRAGPCNVFDALGAETLARCRIPLLVVDGRDLGQLEAAIRGMSFSGTVVDEKG